MRHARLALQFARHENENEKVDELLDEIYALLQHAIDTHDQGRGFK